MLHNYNKTNISAVLGHEKSAQLGQRYGDRA